MKVVDVIVVVELATTTATATTPDDEENDVRMSTQHIKNCTKVGEKKILKSAK